MFRFVLFCLICSAFASKTFAQQNLVPNPSFEEYSDCPQEVGEFSKVEKWKNFRGSPDYYNECSDTFVSVPCNRLGCQEPANGIGYAGVYTYVTIDNYREFIGIDLVENLIVGETYYISFKVSPAQGGDEQINCFSNKMGLRFSNTQYNENHPAPVNNFAHLYSSSIVTDTAIWTTIEGMMTADSAYSHIILGNFFDNASTDTFVAVTNAKWAYYYVDDICVTTNPLGCIFTSSLSNTANNQFIVYPNPVSERLYLEQVYHSESNVMLYDIIGRLVPVSVKYQKRLTEIDVSQLQSGLYYLRIENQGLTTTKEVFVNH